MKVITRSKKIALEFDGKTKMSKRGNPAKLRDGMEYVVKYEAHDFYGTYYKIEGYQKPFDTQWFWVTEIEKEKVYVQVNVYTTLETFNNGSCSTNILNPIKDLELRQKYKVASATWDMNYGWVFYLEKFEKPILQKYMEVTQISK